MASETLPAVGEGALLDEAALRELQAAVGGKLVAPSDDRYEAARKVWNGMIDRRPACIVQCAEVSDVVHAVRFAASRGLPIAIRGGGHNVAGHGTCDGGLLIDLANMKDIQVDPIGRTVRAQGGVTWKELDGQTQIHGLATTGGLVATTGISGLTLGGGIGWLMRKHGLTCDNVISADVVTADGQTLTASPTVNNDLFWALRGGGGNFGVVTSWEYRLHPVSQVLAGMVLYPIAKAGEVLRFFRDYVASVPDELTAAAVCLTAPPAPFLPTDLHGAQLIAIVVCYCGDVEGGERIVGPLRAFGPPLVDLIGPMPYVALQSMFDPASPPGLQNYWKSTFVRELNDDVIDAIGRHAVKAESPLSQVHIHHLQGAVSRVDADKTAYNHRDAPFIVNVVGMWAYPHETERHVNWTRDAWAALQPWSDGGTYVNFMGEEAEDRVKEAYGKNYERLLAAKRRFDPANLFRFNQNIAPQR